MLTTKRKIKTGIAVILKLSNITHVRERETTEISACTKLWWLPYGNSKWGIVPHINALMQDRTGVTKNTIPRIFGQPHSRVHVSNTVAVLLGCDIALT